MKYKLICKQCGDDNADFGSWFRQNQQCKHCGSKHAEIKYFTDYQKLKKLIECKNASSFWHYFDFLPLEKKENVISCGEGAIPLENWKYLEEIARNQYKTDCKVWVYRNDLNGGTQTFKDIAASLAASVFKENKVSHYCLASTGNTATAYSKYLSLAHLNMTVFVPKDVSKDTVNEIMTLEQKVVIVDGTYADAKKEAVDFHEKQQVMISAGNIDPLRVEAKRTMVFEFLRQLGKLPDIYIQAVSGGTGPIAVHKAITEIAPFFPDIKLPQMFLIQQDTCDPMVQAWENAEQKNFPQGYEKEYPVIENPQTQISILSTGNPAMFPIIAPIVKKSDGGFLRVLESDVLTCAKDVYKKHNLVLGPASIVCLLGFLEALKKGKIRNGESVLINTGESANRAKDFAKMVVSI
jgi:threonine synthase